MFLQYLEKQNSVTFSSFICNFSVGKSIFSTLFVEVLFCKAMTIRQIKYNYSASYCRTTVLSSHKCDSRNRADTYFRKLIHFSKCIKIGSFTSKYWTFIVQWLDKKRENAEEGCKQLFKNKSKPKICEEERSDCYKMVCSI